MSEGMFAEVYVTKSGAVKIYLSDNLFTVMTPENAHKLSNAIETAIHVVAPNFAPACPDCGRPMTRREPWVCMKCESEL